MDLYINSAGIVTSGGSNSTDDFLATAPAYNTNRLQCIEPDYKPFIPPMQLRRMSKAVRMGIAASKISMEQNGEVVSPDAISVGTAIGCIQDSEVFLSKMVDQDEQMLTPTSFIQSTHNTVAGQIALLSGCKGQNITFVHRGHSFEQAMIDAQLYVDEHPGEKVLVGGIDELIDISLAIFRRAGIYRYENSTPDSILNGSSGGSIAGEGAAFFIASDKPSGNTSLHIKDIFLFTAKDENDAVNEVKQFLACHSADGKVDLAMLGVNGDEKQKQFYDVLRGEVFKGISQAAFKHVSGEYATVSAYALGLIYHTACNNKVPEFLLLNDAPKQFRRIILINNYIHYYSCWMIDVIGA